MRGVVLTKVRVENENKENVGILFQKYFLVPITRGVMGYLGFFTLLIISKYLGFLIGNRATFQIDFTDFLLSLLGFVFIFVVKLRETTKGGMV
jgi:hypothetical protein